MAYSLMNNVKLNNFYSNNEKFSDWFLPSRDELIQMYNNLHLYGVGNFSEVQYWSSSEDTYLLAYMRNFSDGTINYAARKDEPYLSRPMRRFTAGVGEYSLRDYGPAGGLIFYVSSGTYYECGLVDNTSAVWSTVLELIGTTSTGLGSGLSNTNAIVDQLEHTTSAAQLCLDYVI